MADTAAALRPAVELWQTCAAEAYQEDPGLLGDAGELFAGLESALRAETGSPS